MIWKRVLRVTLAEAEYRKLTESYYAERNFYKKAGILKEADRAAMKVWDEFGPWTAAFLLLWHIARTWIRHIVLLFLKGV